MAAMLNFPDEYHDDCKPGIPRWTKSWLRPVA